MSPNEEKSNIAILITYLVLLLISILVLGGCAGKSPAAPPYFKDIYETTRESRVAETSHEQAPTAGHAPTSDTTLAATASKPQVKIISLPDPLMRETVTVTAEKPVVPTGTKLPETIEDTEKQQDIKLEIASGDLQVIVENMPIYDFVNLVLGEILKLNYTVSQDVQAAKEKITLNMNRKMSGKVFFPFVISLLRKNNLDVREENRVLNVRTIGQQSAQSQSFSASEVFVGSIPAGTQSQKRVTLLVSTSYVPASQILQLARQLQLISGDVRAEALSGTPAIALTGTVTSLRKVMDLFTQLDRATYAERQFNLIYFDYINVDDFNKKMTEVLPPMGIPIARNSQDPGLLMIPFDKINALMIISQRKEWMETLLSWKDKLDAAESMGDELQLFLYKPKNRTAEDLVNVLKVISSGGAPATTAPPSVPAQQKAAAQSATPAQTAGSSAVLPGKGFSAILDKGRNTIIISSSPANYKLIRNILVQLDSPPKQILIEATIAEVTLNDQLQFGIEWALKHSKTLGSSDYSGTLSTLGGLALGSTGLGYAITKVGGDFLAKLNTFASQNVINVISTPHIVMLDGKDASINVGTEVPIVTAEATASDLGSTTSTSGTTAASILRSVQYRNTGVILKVKPVVNAEGVITLDINQELSEAAINSVSSIDSPTILNRSISTTLSIKSGDTVLLGGLISTNKSTSVSKVPFFGDLPLVGHLFRTDSVGTKKTELIVQITPYIMNDLDQLEEISRKFKDTVFMK